MICHQEGVDLVVAEHLLDGGEFRLGGDGLRGAGHDLADGKIDEVLAGSFHGSTNVAICDDAQDLVAIHHDAKPQFACTDGHQGIGQAHGRWDDGEVVCVHDIFHLHEKFASEGSSWMEQGKVPGLKLAHLHQGAGKGIAHGHGSSGAGGGCKVQRTGFAFHTAEDVVVGVLCQKGGWVAGDGDDGDVAIFERGNDAQEFIGVA